jgi:hypothetical protein
MATKKASPAQIAARKLFAQRAKAGALQKNPRPRKIPVGKSAEFHGYIEVFSVRSAGASGPDALGWFSKKRDAVEYAQQLADHTGRQYAVSKSLLPRSEAPFL